MGITEEEKPVDNRDALDILEAEGKEFEKVIDYERPLLHDREN